MLNDVTPSAAGRTSGGDVEGQLPLHAWPDGARAGAHDARETQRVRRHGVDEAVVAGRLPRVSPRRGHQVERVVLLPAAVTRERCNRHADVSLCGVAGEPGITIYITLTAEVTKQ